MLAAEHPPAACNLAACGPPPPVAAAPRPQLSMEHLAFLHNFQTSLAPKLTTLLTLLSQQQVAANLALVQVWTYVPVLLEGRQVLKAERSRLLGDPALHAFHTSCAEDGCPVSSLGPMGKVWEAGVIKVAQDASNLPAAAHPCDRLAIGGLAERVGEVVYLPVYQPGSKVSSGVVAVVEVLMNHASHDYMVVANVISTISSLLDALQLSICNPAAQQPPAPAAQQQQLADKPQHRSATNSPNGSPTGSRGSLARTSSMRHLH